jgi:hypothetical protein
MIQQHQLVRRFGKSLQGFRAIRSRIRCKSFLYQESPKQFPLHGLVVNDEYPHGFP